MSVNEYKINYECNREDTDRGYEIIINVLNLVIYADKAGWNIDLSWWLLHTYT